MGRQQWVEHGLTYVTDEEYLGNLSKISTSPKILMLSGLADSNTPPDAVLMLQKATKGLALRRYAGVTHVVIENSPCGMSVVLTFLASLGKTILPTPCDNTSAIVLDGSSQTTNSLVKAAFGTDSLYGTPY